MKITHLQSEFKSTPGLWRSMLTVLALLAAFMPNAAFADAISVPFVTEFACDVVLFLKGPMAVVIFVLVVLVTLVFGMVAKVKWEVIITVCIIFGVIMGIGTVIGNNEYVAGISGMDRCFQ